MRIRVYAVSRVCFQIPHATSPQICPSTRDCAYLPSQPPFRTPLSVRAFVHLMIEHDALTRHINATHPTHANKASKKGIQYQLKSFPGPSSHASERERASPSRRCFHAYDTWFPGDQIGKSLRLECYQLSASALKGFL